MNCKQNLKNCENKPMLSSLKPKSEFSRNVLTLMTGTTIAQAIPIAISPILTRIYTPEDFGVFALYMSIASIVSVFATGRYEMAIMLPEDDDDVKSIVKLIMILVSAIAFFSVVIVFFFNQILTDLFDNKALSNWLYFLPVSIFCTGLYQVYNYLLIREKNFTNLSANKIIASTTNSVTQLFFGIMFANSLGLLLGNIFGYIVSIFFIIKHKVLNRFFDFQNISVKKVAIEYQNFPKYDLPSVLVNVVANQLPLLALGKFFGLGVVGFYSLMYKVLMMPIGLVSSSILDVFKQRATEDYHKYGNCKDIYVKTFKSLVLLGIIPFTILGIFAPELFTFVFGEKWRIAGEYAQIMAPMLYLKFVISPLSYTFYVAGKQKFDFIGQMCLLLTIIFAVCMGWKYDSEIILLVALSIGYTIIYLFYLAYSYILSRGIKA